VLLLLSNKTATVSGHCRLLCHVPSDATMKTTLLIVLMIMPGIAGVAIFGHYALQDWGQLQRDYAQMKQVVAASSDMPTLFKANAAQMTQRINLFADGTWTLLSGILAAIGLHGWLISERSRP
jgi:hypothetical protein